MKWVYSQFYFKSLNTRFFELEVDYQLSNVQLKKTKRTSQNKFIPPTVAIDNL